MSAVWPLPRCSPLLAPPPDDDDDDDDDEDDDDDGATVLSLSFPLSMSLSRPPRSPASLASLESRSMSSSWRKSRQDKGRGAASCQKSHI